MRLEVELPDMPYPSLNNRRDKRFDGPMLRKWREASALACREAIGKRGHTPLVWEQKPTVRLHFFSGDNRRRDRVNLALVHKAVVDGIVDAGLVPDDSPDFIDEMMPAIHNGKGVRRWVLVVDDDAGEVLPGLARLLERDSPFE